MTDSKPSQLEQWSSTRADRTVIENFFEFLEENGVGLMDLKTGYGPDAPLRDFLNEYFEINAQRLDAERRALLAGLDFMGVNR